MPAAEGIKSCAARVESPRAAAAQQIRVVDCYSQPHAFVEVSETEPWRLLGINAPAQKVTGARALPCRTYRACVLQHVCLCSRGPSVPGR